MPARYSAKSYDGLFPYVRHVQLRDTGRGANQFQVRVGQGEMEYGRIVAQLARCNYNRLLSVDIRDETGRAVCHAAGSAKAQISAGKSGLIDRDVSVECALD